MPAGGLGHRGWTLTLGAAGAFYALFGAFRLGVWADLALLAGALALIPFAFARRRDAPLRLPHAAR